MNDNKELIAALELAKMAIESMIEDGRCGHTFLASALTLDRINMALQMSAKEQSND